MKVITLLLDGLGDRAYEELGHKTPLEYAKTPNLDSLAKISECGTMMPLRPGISLGTDLAHFLLFGYSLDEYPTRTIIDACGEGVDFDKSDVLLRASFASAEKNDGYWLNSRFTAELNFDEIQEIIKLLNRQIDGIKFEIIHSYDSHGFVKITDLRENRLSSQISDSDPFYINQYAMKLEPFETKEENAVYTSKIVNRFLKENFDILDKAKLNDKRRIKGLLPSNFILTKWAGRDMEIPSFKEKSGMHGVIIGKSKLLKGIAELTKMNYRTYETFQDAVHMAIESDEDYVHLHTKTIDTASHTKDIYNKIREIEMIDSQIKELMNFKGLLIVTADHSTPSSGKMIHSGEYVPFMASGKHMRRDFVDKFSEIHCAQGSIRLTASDFINYVNNARDEGKLYHLRSGSIEIQYINRDIKKLL